ncbi:BAG family molecular chaperone regulator 4 [Sesamum indicum]|uniref:BAG family molecular chaperone regulator 4 n=1 Tax=Sesamum indicum TaxID=4182 RepID=A0A6I9U6X6_SESIN|nr:BAG family molecular chaperone regulator 4 [Sesamum indicum]
MTSFNPTRENGDKNGGIEAEIKPDGGPASISVKVSHGLNQYDVAVPSNSTFGDLKSVIVQKIGLKPEMHKLLFRGKEKEDDEDLQRAGVKDNSKVLLMENTTCRENNAEEVKQTSVISRGGAAVAEIREEVDKLSQQVLALQAVVDSGTKVDDKDIIYLTEMLMRQLLKLDGIEAEGEGKVQRKMEVRRVQSFVETMDILKSRNSKPLSSVTTQWETFEPGFGSMSTMPMPSSSPTLTNPTPMTSSTPTPTPIPTCTSTPTTMTSSTPLPTRNPTAVMSSTPSPIPYPVPYSAPSQLPSSAPSPAPLSTPSSMPSSAPSPAPLSAPLPMPSSTKVTQDWEHFD